MKSSLTVYSQALNDSKWEHLKWFQGPLPARRGHNLVRTVLCVKYRGTSLIRNSTPQDPTVAIYLGPYGGLKGGGCTL